MTAQAQVKLAAGRSDRASDYLIPALAVVVPIGVLSCITWALETFARNRHTSTISTVSHAISQPGVALPFAVATTIGAALLAVVCWYIVMLYNETIASTMREAPRCRFRAHATIAAAGIAQLISICGIVVLSWNAYSVVHIFGSYLFFFGEAFAVLLSGWTCRQLATYVEQQRVRNYVPLGLSVALSRFRWRAALAVAGLALLFWALYLVREHLDVAPLWLHQTFSIVEIGLITSFLSYLATYTLALHRWRRGRQNIGAWG